MSQMMKDPNTSGLRRPGQRQQERLQRIERRKRRLRIILSSVVAALVLIAAVIGIIFYAKHSADVAVRNDAHATATANAVAAGVAATAQVTALNATATANAINNQQAALVKQLTKENPSGPAAPPPTTNTPTNLGSGLQAIVINPGTGPVVKQGDTINVEYTGWIQGTNKKFDSSYDHGGQPFSVTVGGGQVIPGWDKGLPGAKIGETRRLIIPPSLGYGSQDQKDSNGKVIIPANSTLIFDVTIVGYGQPAQPGQSGQ